MSHPPENQEPKTEDFDFFDDLIQTADELKFEEPEADDCLP